jgi:hypothetical protein
MYVEPSQIFLHSGGNLLFTYQTAHGFIKVRGKIRFMSINLYKKIIDKGHRIAAKNMNDNIELRIMGV